MCALRMLTLRHRILPPFKHEGNINLMIIIKINPGFPDDKMIFLAQIIHRRVFRAMKFVIFQFIVEKLLGVRETVLPFGKVVGNHVLGY